jgi:hypothetical protein
MRIFEARSVLDPTDTYLFREVSSTPLIAGTELQKSVVEVSVGNSALILSYIQRPHNQHYIDTWKYFRRKGMPVALGLFEVVYGDSPCLLVPDMKADGSELYGKSLESQLHEGSERSRPPRPIVDELFLDLVSPARIHEVEALVDVYVELASENRITLPTDDPFELHVGYYNWDLTTIDLDQGGRDLNVMATRELASLNTEIVDDFF